MSSSSGPNGTELCVSGSGFAASAVLTVKIDGLGTGVVTDTATPTPLTMTASSAGALSSSSNGFVIGGLGSNFLTASAHTITVSDTSGDIATATFTITTPTVTLSTLSGGTSGPGNTPVLVSGSGFVANGASSCSGSYTPSSYGISTTAGQITFGGVNVPVVAALATSTASTTTLSSSVIAAAGSYSGTVELPVSSSTSGSTFSIADTIGNAATFVWTLTTTATVSVASPSPASGAPGTLVVISGSGFAPNNAISSVKFGSTTVTTQPASPTTTAAGTVAFAFAVPSGTADSVAGSHTITVKDSQTDSGSASFTITPTVSLALGDGTTSSATTTVPTGTTGTQLFISSVSGFAAGAKITITGSPNVPSGWTSTTFTVSSAGAWSPGWSNTATTAPAAGTYSLTFSDGTNTFPVSITVMSSGTYAVLTTNTSPAGTVETVTYFGAPGGSSATSVTFDGTSQTLTCGACASTHAGAWPAAPTGTISFTVPTSVAGTHSVIFTAGSAYPTITFTTLTGTPTLSLYPSTAPAGTTVVAVTNGFRLSASSFALTVGGISVTFTGAGNTNNLAGTASTEVGTFTVPALSAGAQTASLSDATNPPINTASGTLTISSASATPTATSGTLASALSFTGSGFVQATALTVKFGSTALSITTGLTSSNDAGQALLATANALNTYSLAAADAVNGAHTVSVTDGLGNTATFTFTVTARASLSTSTGRAGSACVGVQADGLKASTAYTVSFAGTAQTVYSDTACTVAIASASMTTTSSGGLPNSGTGVITPSPTASTASVYFVVPSTASTGSNTVTVSDGTNAPTATFTVLAAPTVALDASQGSSGETGIQISGSGFTPGTRTLSWTLLSGSTTVASGTIAGVVITSTGAISTTTVPTWTVPTVGSGSYTFKASFSSPTETATTSFTVIAPSITVSPTSGSPKTAAPTVFAGTTLTITGSGFQRGTLLTTLAANAGTMLGTASLTSKSTTAKVATDSTFSGTFTFGALAAGSYTLTVSDGTHSASTSFTVVPGISLSATSGLKGISVTISGAGFAASSTLTATFGGASVSIGTVSSDASGDVQASTSFTVPITASVGSNTVTVSDGTNSASATFTVSSPTLTISPTSGAAGTSVQLTGTGYLPSGGTVVVTVGGVVTSTTPSSVSVSASGTFVAYVTIPSTATGTVTIAATDGSGNTGTATFTVPGVITIGTATFTQTTAAAETTVGTFKTVSASWTNAGTSSLQVLMFVQLSGSAGVFVIGPGGPATIGAGATVTMYAALGSVPVGTYTVTEYLITTNGVAVSSTTGYASTITIS